MRLLSWSLLKSRAFLFFSIFVWAKYVSWSGFSRSTQTTQNGPLFATGFGHSKTLITQLDLQIELFQRLTKDRVSSVNLNESWRVAAARQCSLQWVVGETVQRSLAGITIIHYVCLVLSLSWFLTQKLLFSLSRPNSFSERYKHNICLETPRTTEGWCKRRFSHSPSDGASRYQNCF